MAIPYHHLLMDVAVIETVFGSGGTDSIGGFQDVKQVNCFRICNSGR